MVQSGSVWIEAVQVREALCWDTKWVAGPFCPRVPILNVFCSTAELKENAAVGKPVWRSPACTFAEVPQCFLSFISPGVQILFWLPKNTELFFCLLMHPAWIQLHTTRWSSWTPSAASRWASVCCWTRPGRPSSLQVVLALLRRSRATWTSRLRRPRRSPRPHRRAPMTPTGYEGRVVSHVGESAASVELRRRVSE